MKTANKRHLITEALALKLGYKVDGKTGTVDGVDLRHARAEVVINEAPATRRVGLGAAAGVAGIASFGILAAPLALLGLKKKDNTSVTITLHPYDVAPASQPRTFNAKHVELAIKFAARVNDNK